MWHVKREISWVNENAWRLHIKFLFFLPPNKSRIAHSFTITIIHLLIPIFDTFTSLDCCLFS